MDCANCEDFELYHDCDDPDILPEDRKIKKEDNCAVWLCSGSCKKQSSNKEPCFVNGEKVWDRHSRENGMKIEVYWDWFGFDWFHHSTRFMFDKPSPYLLHQYSIGFVAFCWSEFERI